MTAKFGTDLNPNGMMNLYGRRPGSPLPYTGFAAQDVRLSMLTYTTTLEALAQCLPPPLKPASGVPPVISAVFSDTLFCRNQDGRNHPYRKLGFWVPCQYKDMVGLTHLFLHLDGPGADINTIMGREQYGISKKYGEIMYYYDNDECRATVVRYGVPLITLRLKWKEEISTQKAPLGAANKCMWVKEIPNCTFTGYDVRKVICQDWGAAGKPKRLRIGQGSIELGHLEDDAVTF